MLATSPNRIPNYSRAKGKGSRSQLRVLALQADLLGNPLRGGWGKTRRDCRHRGILAADLSRSSCQPFRQEKARRKPLTVAAKHELGEPRLSEHGWRGFLTSMNPTSSEGDVRENQGP